MKFIHISDPHLVAPGEKPYGRDPELRLKACLDDIARHHSDADFCAVTGDLTENGDQNSYELLKGMLAALPFKTHLVLGNCDNRCAFLSVFGGQSEEGYLQSSFRNGDKLFLFLDTLGDEASAAGRYDPPRQAWLRRTLEVHSGTQVYLFMHHPPLDIGHTNDDIKLKDVDAFAAVLKGHGVKHIFFGHVHRAVSGQWRGISFSGVPGLPFQLPLVAGSVPTTLSDEPPMYSVVTLRNERIVINFDCFMHRLANPTE
jgi:3',5'-cyclic-AMP phosphodiesterase